MWLGKRTIKEVNCLLPELCSLHFLLVQLDNMQFLTKSSNVLFLLFCLGETFKNSFSSRGHNRNKWTRTSCTYDVDVWRGWRTYIFIKVPWTYINTKQLRVIHHRLTVLCACIRLCNKNILEEKHDEIQLRANVKWGWKYLLLYCYCS